MEVLRQYYKRLLKHREEWLKLIAVRPGGGGLVWPALGRLPLLHAPAGRASRHTLPGAVPHCRRLASPVTTPPLPGQADGECLRHFNKSSGPHLPHIEAPLDPDSP